MSWLELVALLPVLILSLGSALLLLLGAWWPRWRPLLLGGVAIALLAALTAGLQQPPLVEAAAMFGTGPYARFFTILWSLLAALVLILSQRYGEERHFDGGVYVPLVLFAAAGMSLLSGATSLVGLFLGLEAYTLVLYILIAFDRNSPLGAEAGLKYLIMGAVATGFLALGIALIYAASGTFHLSAALQGLTGDGGLRPLGLLGWLLLLLAAGFKVSLAPLHLWTPDVYQGAPAPVGGLLATGSKGAVFAALLGLCVAQGEGLAPLIPLLWGLAALTMVVGTVSALVQENLKRMLAYSSVVHMGMLLIGLVAGSVDGQAAVVFYLVVYSAATLGAFAVITSLAPGGEEVSDYRRLRGIGYRHAFRTSALAVFLVSLAGLPPTAGFIGKFGLFHAALSAGYLGLALLGVLASVVSVYYYLRVVVLFYMVEEESYPLHHGCQAEYTVLAFCLTATLGLGLLPGALLDLARQVLP